jgi:ubiquitin-conjugating enzyme E2 J2
MNETAHTTGSISSTKAEKRRFSKMSLEYNLRNPMFRKLFPEYQEEFRRRQLEEEVEYPILMQYTRTTPSLAAP